jgi:hypothetical protein
MTNAAVSAIFAARKTPFTRRALLLMIVLTLIATPVGAQRSRPGPSCPPDIINLRVTFADATGDLFRSDGRGPYVTSKAKGSTIDIRFQRGNCSYDLTMDLSHSNRTMRLTLGASTLTSTFFNFDRVASVPVTDPNNQAFVDFCGGRDANDQIIVNTPNVVLNADGTYQYDNYAGSGVDESGNYFVRRSVGINAGDSNHGFRYQYSTIDNVATWAAGTDYLRVYHPSQFVWTLTPDTGNGSCGLGGHCGRYYDKSTSTSLGDYSVPFSITVEQIN